MSFDEEQLEDLYAAFPDLQNNGAIASDDIRPALEKLGCPIAGHELREIQGGRARGGALCDIDELYQIYMKAKFLKIDSKKIFKDAILKGVQEAKVMYLFLHYSDLKLSLLHEKSVGYLIITLSSCAFSIHTASSLEYKFA